MDCNIFIIFVFVVSFGILVLLLLLCLVGIKLKWIKIIILCLKKNDIESKNFIDKKYILVCF